MIGIGSRFYREDGVGTTESYLNYCISTITLCNGFVFRELEITQVPAQKIVQGVSRYTPENMSNLYIRIARLTYFTARTMSAFYL